jgi:hypothetical protein
MSSPKLIVVSWPIWRSWWNEGGKNNDEFITDGEPVQLLPR